MKAQVLKGRIVGEGLTQDEVAKMIGVDRSTFYRKMASGRFLIGEAGKIKEILHLDDHDANSIFFTD